MRIAIVVVFAALSACATPASNDTSMATAASRQICKRTTATDSNVPQRVCHTKEEWAAREKQGQADIDAFERARDEVTSTGQ